MGTSTDAILAYGYDLGEWDKIQEAGEFGELSLPWIDDDSDDSYSEAASEHLLATIAGFAEEWAPDTNYWERKQAAEATVGVVIKSYCSDAAPMHILAAKVITVSRGDCETLDLAELMAAPAEHGWDDKLRAACEALGITPTQERPAWVLASYWG